ncbi:protein mono-ADP-ribosyltransferase PARP16 [Aplysia californica]|uniref:Poly [ADP-ribose] polymerase n=1 Tax=Aplysia californica TaxID=6500 RepID=A0ABM0JBD0_APLCA|nr:protein mono-ADP-ribosyltransferase PARP16 [Aplysia californica]
MEHSTAHDQNVEPDADKFPATGASSSVVEDPPNDVESSGDDFNFRKNDNDDNEEAMERKRRDVSQHPGESSSNGTNLGLPRMKLDIADLIRTDIYCCDLLWCLFVSAARSYRFSSVLRPFPPMYQEGDNKNMFALKNVISSVPQFSTTPQFLQDLPNECQTLLSWLFNVGHFKLQLREKDSAFKAVKEMTGQIMDTTEPNYVFEVVHTDEMDRKFENLRNGRKCFFAYHGSRFDNFYSILLNGLNTHLNKVSVFGEGTYLSSELSVSLMYSPAAESSRHSLLGSKLACVAVCQMIDDPSVKCQVKEGSVSKQKVRAQASKVTDLVPEKYYVVQRNDVLRVKYLLLYKEESSQIQTTANTSSSWIRDNKFTLLMVAYVLLLVAIGIANSRHAMIYLNKFWKNVKLS